MIDLTLSEAEITEILFALTAVPGANQAAPSLILYLRGKEKQAKYAEARQKREEEKAHED